MPVPKKRRGNSDQWTRRSQWKGSVPQMNVCPNCGSAKLTHKACGFCGYYKGRVVMAKPASRFALATAQD
jgi:large subunit ribosomal protein L32